MSTTSTTRHITRGPHRITADVRALTSTRRPDRLCRRRARLYWPTGIGQCAADSGTAVLAVDREREPSEATTCAAEVIA